jgi:nucleotidyltransferase/DNA polymerase involved in DNA repair
MDLKHIKGIGPAKQEKLKAAGISSVDELARADAETVAKEAGLPLATVREYKQKAAALALLEDLKGVGPATVGILAEAGVASLKDLYTASAKRLSHEIQVAQHKVEGWQKQAREASKRIAEQAKTAEGRQKLLKESKDMAVEGAAKAQAAAKQAIAYAQKESQVIQARAKEFQAKAPEYVEKAQVAFKDAQAKVTVQVKKAQDTVTHEAQKVKAQAEKVLADTKARVRPAPAK